MSFYGIGEPTVVGGEGPFPPPPPSMFNNWGTVDIDDCDYGVYVYAAGGEGPLPDLAPPMIEGEGYPSPPSGLASFNNWGLVDIDDSNYGLQVGASTGFFLPSIEGAEVEIGLGLEAPPLATFNNHGTVDINQSGSTGVDIYIEDGLCCVIEPPMMEEVEEMEEIELALFAPATVQNWGSLTVRNTNENHAIKNEGAIANYSAGMIKVDDVDEGDEDDPAGIFNYEGVVTNYGWIDLDDLYDDAIRNVYGLFINIGSIDIKDADDEGIENYDAFFLNLGDIYIDDAGENAIYNMGFFFNIYTGSITIENSYEGIYHEGDSCEEDFYVFINQGTISIDNTEEDGIYVSGYG